MELPISQAPPLDQVYEEIDTTIRHFRRGEWPSCISSPCTAIQALEPHLQAGVSPTFSDRAHVKNPKAAEEKVRELSQAFGLMSAGAHLRPGEGDFERPDAEFVLNLALDCRRYAGLRLVKRM